MRLVVPNAQAFGLVAEYSVHDGEEKFDGLNQFGDDAFTVLLTPCVTWYGPFWLPVCVTPGVELEVVMEKGNPDTACRMAETCQPPRTYMPMPEFRYFLPRPAGSS